MDGPSELRTRAVEYPESDGQPMGETDWHAREMQRWLIEVLQHRYEDAPDVYVSGNNFLYYTEGDPRDCVSPDCYVVRGVEKRLRRTFKVWEEGGATPCVVIEVTSRNTRRNDAGDKRTIYANELGVPEYFLFDPDADWIPGRLRGYRLGADGEYVLLEPAGGPLRSEELGLDLVVRDGHLRFVDVETGEMLPTDRERIEQERARADALAAEVARLREELRRARPDAE